MELGHNNKLASERCQCKKVHSMMRYFDDKGHFSDELFTLNQLIFCKHWGIDLKTSSTLISNSLFSIPELTPMMPNFEGLG